MRGHLLADAGHRRNDMANGRGVADSCFIGHVGSCGCTREASKETGDIWPAERVSRIRSEPPRVRWRLRCFGLRHDYRVTLAG
jgi:hypothetical protein